MSVNRPICNMKTTFLIFDICEAHDLTRQKEYKLLALYSGISDRLVLPKNWTPFQKPAKNCHEFRHISGRTTHKIYDKALSLCLPSALLVLLQTPTKGSWLIWIKFDRQLLDSGYALVRYITLFRFASTPFHYCLEAF